MTVPYLTPAFAAAYRTVPVEVLREFVRSQAELSSLRYVAEDAGVGRSTVHKFITAGTMPHPRVRRLLALWYLRRLEGVNEIEFLRPYVSALDVLLAEVAEPSPDVTLTVLEGMAKGFENAGEQTPRWLQVLRARLLRHRGSIYPD
jgi:hypothetical protein